MSGLRLKCVAPIQNTSGGTVNPMATGDKKAILSALGVTFEYGIKKRSPYKNLDFRDMRILQRDLMGSEIEGWSDTVTGMARSLPNSATTNVTFYVVLPFQAWFLGMAYRNFFALGRSQCRTVECELSRVTSPTAFSTSGLALNGAITIDVLPQLVSVKGDRWAIPPEFRKFAITDFRYTFPDDGLPLLVAETTAVHASTSLTKINLKIGDEEIHRDAAPADMLTEQNDVASYPSEGAINDEYTLLYQTLPDREFADLPSGQTYIEQPAKDLATMNLAILYVPVVTEQDRKDELENIGNNLRQKTVQAVNLSVIEGKRMRDELHAFQPSVILDQDDAEFHKYPGLGVAYRQKPDVYIPPSVLGQAKQRAAVSKASGGGDIGVTDVAKQVAAAVPGAATSGKGYKNGGDAYARILNAVKP